MTLRYKLLIISAFIFFYINEINSKVILLTLHMMFSGLIISYATFFAFNDNGATVVKYNIISWAKDFKFVRDNNQPSTVDVIVNTIRYKHVEKSRGKVGRITNLVELHIDTLTLKVKDEGLIKEFLHRYKSGTKVKLYYLPNTNRLLSIEND